MSTICKNWTQWLEETRFSGLTDEMKMQTFAWLESVGNTIITMAQIEPSDTILDIGTGTGLLGFKALEVLDNLNGDGKVIFSDKFGDCLESCKEFLSTINTNVKTEFINSPCENFALEDNSIDKALMRSVLVHIVDKQPAINEIYRIVKPGKLFCAFEPIIRSNTRHWQILDPEYITDYEDFKKAENEIMTDETDSLCNFDESTLKNNLELAGFTSILTKEHLIESKYVVTREMVEPWFTSPPSPDRPSMKALYLKYFSEDKIDRYIEESKNYLEGKEVTVRTNSVLIIAIK